MGNEMPEETKLARAWRTLFQTYDVVNQVAAHGFVDLTANQLRVEREPRLLTKIDHKEHLPAVFADNGLGILTLSNNSWRIGPFQTFQELTKWVPPDSKVKRVNVPVWIESLTQNLITGEGAAMNAAYACGILEEFCGQKMISTITGRGGSGDFDFVIGSKSSRHNISVRGAQIEVDGGYEGEDSLCLFEAKRHICQNFNVRQIYYPMRAWSSRVHKPVRTVFLTYANNVFDLYDYDFKSKQDFSSIQLVKHDRFLLSSGEVDLSTLQQFALTHSAQNGFNTHAKAGQIPCPQADDFERIIDLVEFLAKEPSTKDDIATQYPIVPRQIDYYVNAARYLGLVERSVIDVDGVEHFQASTMAQEILRQPNHTRLLKFAEVVLLYGPISLLYARWRETGEFPSKSDVVESFRQSPASSALKESTLVRRASTVRMWLKWVCALGPLDIATPEIEAVED